MHHHHFTLASGSRLHYTTLGDAHQQAVFCVHGLTRNARDFDALALRLSSDFYVVSIDVIGRGESDWAREPSTYNLFSYAQHCTELLASLGLTQENQRAPHWVGTSMGGLIALTLQHLKPNSFRKLVLNDVGPVIEMDALKRIAQYVGAAPSFPTRVAAQAYARTIFASFGAQTLEEWAALTDHYYIDQPDGSVRMHYDPQVAAATKTAVESMNTESVVASEAVLWASLKSLTQPCLVLRGAESDLLSPATLLAMQACNPNVQTLTVPNCGHAPHLLDAFQTQAIKDFLL